MHSSREQLQRLTSGLRDPARARSAARALAGTNDPAALRGLCDLLADPPDEAAGVAAVQALAACDHPQARQSLRQAVRSGSARIRFVALRVLRRRGEAGLGPLLGEVLAQDPSPRVRREALRTLTRQPPGERWPLLTALSDPIWRVRHDAVQILLTLQREDPSVLEQVHARLAPLSQQSHATQGALLYLEFLARSDAEPPPPSGQPRALPGQPWRAAAWWDDDPAVLERNLRQLTEREVRASLPLLPELLTLQDGRPVWPYLQGIFRFVLGALERFGRPENLTAALRLLEEPRLPQLAARLRQLLNRLPTERRPMNASAVLPASPGGETVRGQGGSRHPARGPEPARARLHDWQLPPVPVQGRPLGATGLTVSPLGLSGRYDLPGRGFREAMDAGINLFFWEPGCDTQTRCWQQLAPSVKDKLLVVSGSFAAEPRCIRRDLEQALRTLRLERLDVFLLFWVRSPGRLQEEALEALEEMRHAGLVRAVGLSTHLRWLAVQALRDGWEVLMVRHSLAHRGAEEELLPVARETGAGIIAFSSLCYGRLPKVSAIPRPPCPPPRPADCYRYTLSQPGVSACLSAPRNLEELRHNLEVLRQPALAPEAQAALRPWGDAVYRQHRAFVEWLRSR